MNIDEYKEKVIQLFRSGKATEEQYKDMAEAVLNMSESESGCVLSIDAAIFVDL